MYNKDISRTEGTGRNIIFLSEFPEGTLEAIRFSMQILPKTSGKLVFVQAYRKPDFGQSFLNSFVRVLERTAKNELGELKKRALRDFSIDEDRIYLCPYEGDLVSFIRCEQIVFDPCILVVSAKKAFADASSGICGKAMKVASNTPHPLFILPDSLKKSLIRRVLFFAGTIGQLPKKMDRLVRLSLLKNDTVFDLKLVFPKGPYNMQADAERLINRLFCETDLPLGSTEFLSFCDLSILSTREFSPDLVIIDQDLISLRDKRKKLNLKSWIENKQGIPLLII